MENQSGVLTMKICDAILIRDTEAMGLMDPFISIEYNNHVYRTQVKVNAGKTPVWNETFEFTIKNMNADFKMTCYDQDLTSDDVVGERTLKGMGLCSIFLTRNKISMFYKN